MLTEFEGKVAVVTGAASGIGKAMCVRFAQAGMKVVLADVENDALREAGRDIEKLGVEALTFRTDVSQPDQVSALAEATLERFGKVHVVCNNAGVFAGGRTWDAIGTDWEWVIGVNVYGVLHGIRAFVPIMLEQNEPAHVVNTCSMAGLINMPLSGVYNVSKHAALSLTETLYHELQTMETPVGVSALCPELIRTGIGRSERNRPAHLKRGDEEGNVEQEMVEAAKGRPVILINGRMGDVQSSAGVMSYRGRADRLDFVDEFRECFHFSLVVPPGRTFFPILGAVCRPFLDCPYALYRRLELCTEENRVFANSVERAAAAKSGDLVEKYEPVGCYGEMPTAKEQKLAYRDAAKADLAAGRVVRA